MLKNLLKYDLKKVYKNLIIFYSLSLFFGVLTRIFLNIDNSMVMLIIGKICSGITISMFFNIIINNLMRLWVTFTANLYGDESYLTHTLPITTNTLYLSKVLTTLITMLTSTLTIALTLFIAYYTPDNFNILKETLSSVANIYNTSITPLILIVIIIFFLELITIVSAGYNGIIIGHTKNNNKNALSVVFGIVSYLISQVLLIIIVYLIALFNKDIMSLFTTNNIPNISTIKILMYIAIIVYLIYFFIYYIINIKILKKGVNID